MVLHFSLPSSLFWNEFTKKVKRPQRLFPRPLYISSLLCTPLFVCYLPSYLSFQRSLSSLRGFTGRRSSYKVTAFDQISMRSFPLYIFMLLAWSLRFCELTQERLAWLACPFQHPQSYYFGLDKQNKITHPIKMSGYIPYSVDEYFLRNSQNFMQIQASCLNLNQYQKKSCFMNGLFKRVLGNIHGILLRCSAFYVKEMLIATVIFMKLIAVYFMLKKC